MIFNYFKIAWRSIWRHKLFTFINITGLSIGISAALVIYLIVQFDFNFDKFHDDKERIYHVVTDFKFSGVPYHNGGVAAPLREAVRTEMTGIAASAPFDIDNEMRVMIPDGSKNPVKFRKQVNNIYADSRYFTIFKYKWLAGSAKSLNEPYNVVLSAKQAAVYFPRMTYAQMLGREIIFSDTINTTVTGIVQDYEQNTDFTYQTFISAQTRIAALPANRRKYGERWDNTNGSSQLYVKLNSNADPVNIEKQMNALLKKHSPNNGKEANFIQVFKLQPLSDLHFNSDYAAFLDRTANTTTLYGLLAIAAFLLLLGCINFINLTTAQVSQRAKEIGIRKTIGSRRSQLIIQFLSETFLVTLFAVIVSVLIAPFILKVFADFIPAGITLDILHKPGIIAFLLILSVVVCLLSGFYPAMVLSGYRPVQVLKNQSVTNAGKTRNAWLRKSLTVTQFIIAQFFIMATILVSKQVSYSLNKDLGFKKDAILTIELPWNDKNPNNKQYFVNQLQAMPQVEMVSLGGAAPSSNNYNTSAVKYKDGKKEISTDLQKKSGDENYIKLYKIKLLAGRDIRHGDTSESMIINQTYARMLGFKNPADAIGKMLWQGEQSQPIIGVVADFHQSSLHEAIKPLAIISSAVYNNDVVHIALRPQGANSGSWKKAIAGMEASWKSIYPEEDFKYEFVDESIKKFYDNEQRISKLLAWSTGLSIFISCLGLLGLAIYTTGLRTKEIGVRKVLGSTVAQIVTLLSKELVVLVALAFILVTPVAYWAMNKWMQNFSERTTISWWIFALSGLGMLLTAVITLSFQTIKAATANPVKSLRSE